MEEADKKSRLDGRHVEVRDLGRKSRSGQESTVGTSI